MKIILWSFSVVLLTCIVIEATFLGMSGGGCGCSSGCGRKKREVLGQQIRTENDSPCPQLEWKAIIEENLRNDTENTKYAVQGALYKHYEEKFFVACVDKSKQHLIDQLRFVSNGEAYCNHGNDKVWCQVLALYG